MNIIDSIINLPTTVLSHWGYVAILFFSLTEAIPALGMLIPGQVVLLLSGFLAKLQILNLGNTILVAAVGAIIGDSLGYLIGRKYGQAFVTRFGKYVFFKQEHFEKTKALIHEHAGKTLIIGRLHSFTRTLAPFVAGSSGLPFIKFLSFNIIGGLSWAALFVLAGYFFGQSYEVAGKYIGKFIFIAITISIVFILLYRFLNKKAHIFDKYHLHALIINISSLYIFSKMIEDRIDNELMMKIDLWININIVSIWDPLITKMILWLNFVFNPLGLTIITLGLLTILIYRKKWYYSVLLFLSTLGGYALVLMIKSFTQNIRPENALTFVSGFSFPSGHATLATIFFSLVVYSFKDSIKNKNLRILFICINVIIVALIGFSRVYLNVHWLSDVIAGFCLGLFLVTLLILILKALIPISPKKLVKTKAVLEKHIR